MKPFGLFNKLAKYILLFTYLIVLAGGFVRMTGSGMGCPDWPKCFGLWIPPVSETQLPQNYIQEYKISLEHDVKFNVQKTWTEYINRCIGAFTGLLVLILFFISCINYKKTITHKRLFIGSFFLMLLFLFQAWIGGEVVYSVLNPFKVTIHMFLALLIVCCLIILIYITESRSQTLVTFKRNTRPLLFLTLFCSLIQIFFGSQIREFLDVLEPDKFIWSNMIEKSYINTHKLMASVVFLSNSFLCISLAGAYSSIRNVPKEIIWVFLALMCLIISGIIMTTFNFPGLAQLIHLVSAFILFGAQFSLFLKINCSLPNQ